MDAIKNMVGGGEKKPTTQQQQTADSSSGGGWSDKLNSMAGGGKASEKNEDALDKGMVYLPLRCSSYPFGGVANGGVQLMV